METIAGHRLLLYNQKRVHRKRVLYCHGPTHRTHWF